MQTTIEQYPTVIDHDIIDVVYSYVLCVFLDGLICSLASLLSLILSINTLGVPLGVEDSEVLRDLNCPNYCSCVWNFVGPDV